ncbi:hypothetical protein PI125_g18940 [Phytophthora idaei]|nr:hypothetical protein PI125_g18940 [Phytophthora idaei]
MPLLGVLALFSCRLGSLSSLTTLTERKFLRTRQGLSSSSAGLIGLWPPWSLSSECTDSRPPSLGSGVRSPAASSEWLPSCLALASATVPGLCSRSAKRGFGPSSFGDEGDRLRRELAPVSTGASPDEVTALRLPQ